MGKDTKIQDVLVVSFASVLGLFCLYIRALFPLYQVSSDTFCAQMNMTEPPVKTSNIERRLNTYIIGIFFTLFILCCARSQKSACSRSLLPL